MARKPIKRIHIDGVEYTYIIGRGDIVIRNPERKTILTDFSKVSGWDNNSIERGMRKRYFSVGPGDVKRWLEIYLKAKADFSIWQPGWRK